MTEGKQATGMVHFGYLVVAAMVLTSFIPLSLGLSCAGIFYPALSDHLGIERGMLSYYTSVLWVAALVALPFMGKLLNSRDARACLTGAVAVIDATRSYLPMFVGVIALMALTIVTVIAIGRMQRA